LAALQDERRARRRLLADLPRERERRHVEHVVLRTPGALRSWWSRRGEAAACRVCDDLRHVARPDLVRRGRGNDPAAVLACARGARPATDAHRVDEGLAAAVVRVFAVRGLLRERLVPAAARERELVALDEVLVAPVVFGRLLSFERLDRDVVL